MHHLHHLAPHYWNKPETANCTLIIPVPVSLPNVDSAQRITFRLHTQYLSAKSPFLRGLFSGISPLDLVQNLCPSPSAPIRVPRSRLPRLLPSHPSHPVLFLPVPDPSSIQSLLHWIYFGNTDLIENALDQGDIKWEGLARNVEFLGLSTEIKVFLGRWYRNWILPAPRCTPCPADDDDDDDDESDSEYDDEYYYSSTPPTDDDECDRGRSRDVKPLIRLCKRLRM